MRLDRNILRVSVALLLLVAPPIAAQPPAITPSLPVEGVSGEDIGTILLTLARGHPDLLSLASPLHTGSDKVSLPPETLDAVRDPPPLDATLAALAATFGSAPLGPRAPLPADLERALSMLGQGILAAEALRAADDPYAGAMALRDAYELALPLLERDTIVLSHPDAFGALVHDEPAAQSSLADLVGARDERDALRLARIPEAGPVEARPLADALALAYLRLGLPIDAPTRAALEAAAALDPALRDPLALALAHVERAWTLRDEALATLAPGQRAALASSPEVRRALLAPAPSAGDLALLAHYGAAVDALDREKLLEAAGHALAAGSTLQIAAPSPEGLLPCCAGEADPDDPSIVRFGVGGLLIEARASGRGDVRVWIGEGDDEPTLYPNAFVAIDPDRLSVLVHDEAGRQLFATPALAEPSNDVLFQDPYGFVVVSGHGRTTTDARFGGRLVEVLLPDDALPGAGPAGEDPLDALDAALAQADPYGAWPVASEPVRRALGAQIEAPSTLRVRVNPASYQILRWDLGGDDVYLTNAGGAGSRGLVAIVADGAGEILRDDAAATSIPVAILVDAQGNDLYETRENDTLASANASLALLLDAGGNDAFRSLAPRGLAASDAAGIAILFSRGGSSTYEAANASLVRAAGAATSLLVDAAGDDSYRAGNVTLAASELGALALLLDAGGNDAYRSRAVSQGASRGGIGAIVDAAGNDTYDTAGRLDAQGWAEPYDGIGAARLALFLDAAGGDRGACPEGATQNAQLGALAIGRAPTDPFQPAAGFCVEIDASPIAPIGADGSIAIPPTYFASALANFSLPGLVRFGSAGADLVLDPYLLNVDILGDDTYAVGALARVAAPDEARSFGWLAPVSLHVDTDGNDTHDARLSPHKLPGAFGYAEGGIALHATTSTERFVWSADAPTMLNDTADRHVYRNVTRGLGAAANGGVALFVRDGLSLDVAPSSSAQAPCLLACARTGGVAFAVGRGPGDRIVATPWSLGAVQETELGGLAVYYSRGGRDVYGGSNLSMGYAARVPGELAFANLHEGLVERRPNVALFVDDGFERDDYATPLNWTRGNERFWEDQRTLESFSAFGNRSLHAAQGVDNLDWYANANLAAADEGVAEDTGPGTNSSVAGPPAPPIYQSAFDACVATSPAAAVRNNCFNALNQTRPLFSTYNSTLGAGEIPLGIERGDGGTLTTADGLRPVTLARTPFNPIIDPSSVFVGGGATWYAPGNPEIRAGGTTNVNLSVLDPPAFADQVILGTIFRPPGSSASEAQFGRSVQRVELSIVGNEAWWTGCPVATMRDRHLEEACLVAFWDRQVHGDAFATVDVPAIQHRGPASLSDFVASFSSATRIAEPTERALFPTGNYTLVLRAYAGRPHDLPRVQGSEVRLGVLQGLASDAMNLTDDSYGLYGTAFFIDLPFVPPPDFLNRGSVTIDSNGVAPASFQVNVTEPVRFKVDVRGIGGTDEAREVWQRHPPVGEFSSLLYNDTAAFGAQGHDTIRFVWNATDLPVGMYELLINMTGKISKVSRNSTQQVAKLFVDVDPPYVGVDARGMPYALNATNSPGGLVTLTTDPTQLADPNAPVRSVDVWVQEEILDAADPSVVLESRPWRHAGQASGFNPNVSRIDRTTGAPRAFGSFQFQAEPEPGPPRRYSFAVYHTDRAGNRVVADPLTATPRGPDCVRGECAVFLYDISPPRTSLDMLDPPPALGRVGAANVTLSIDASETPDVASQSTYAVMLSPEEDAAFEGATLGVPAARAPSVVKPNLTVFRDPGLLALAPPGGFALVGQTLNASVQVRPGTHADDYFSDDRGLVLRARILDAASNATVAGPWDHNVTGQLPIKDLTTGGRGPLLDNPLENDTVGIDVHLPNLSGVYTLSIVALPTPGVPNMTNLTEYREGFVLWDALPAPDENATIRAWQPPRGKLVHGHSLVLLTRGVDRAGNVEEKASYDAKLAVDLLPPILTSPPEIASASHAASVRIETDEPARATFAVLAPNGTVVSNATLATAANVHAVTLGGLLPETNYTLRLGLADELANGAMTNVSFRTGSLMDVALEPTAPVVAENTSVRFAPNATIATRVEHALDLSLDGGASFPHAVGTLRAIEIGNLTRAIALDPVAFGESTRAQLRLTTTLLDTDGARVVVYSPLFTLDGRAPRVAVVANGSLGEPTRHPLLINATATDGGTGVARIEWSRAGGAFVELQGAVRLEGSQPETILVRAIDRAGHVSEPTPARLLFDRIAPSIEASTAIKSPTAASVVPIRVRASDLHAGLAHVAAFEDERERFRLSGADLATGEAIALWTLEGGDGERTLALVATDRAGNTAEDRLVVRADRRAPLATVRLVERTIDALRVEVTFDEPARVLATLASREGSRVLASPEEAVRSLRLAIEGLAPGAEHQVALRARDEAGNVGTTTRTFSTTRDFEAPGRVASLRATNLPDGSILLEWPPAVDAGRVLSYHVLRAEGDAHPTPLASVQAERYLDLDVVPGSTYVYAVVPMDAAGNLPDGSDPFRATSRTAPRILEHDARWTDGALVVELSGSDEDGDAPAVELVTSNATLPLEIFRVADGWRARGVLASEPGAFGRELRYHFEADDGIFVARWPPTHDAMAPPATAEIAAEESILVAAAQRVPVGAAWAILGPLLVALALRRRLP